MSRKTREAKKKSLAYNEKDANRTIQPIERRRDYILRKFKENPPYTTRDELIKCIAYYFDYQDSRDAKYTMAGLAFHLGFQKASDLRNYEKNEEFGDIINRTRLFIEAQRNEELVGTGKEKPAGLIFDLVNQHGWRQKSEAESKEEAENKKAELQVTVLPSTPNDLQEWERMYQKYMESKREDQAIDVTENQSLEAAEQQDAEQHGGQAQPSENSEQNSES